MEYKTIAVVLQDVGEAERVLDCAIPLAAKWGIHLVAVHSSAIPLSYATSVGYPNAALVATASEENEKRAAGLLSLFRSRVDAAGVSAEWHRSESFGSGGLADLPAIRSAELVVAAQPDPESGSDMIGSIEALLFESGRPVLLVPYAGTVSAALPKNVLVAWNGSREAARATFDALPFIQQAQTVQVLAVSSDSEEKDISGAKEITAVLERHGAKVELASERADGIAIGDVLENHIVEHGIDLLVMGAYGDSRLKEWLFGGTTRSLLKSMPCLTLLSR